jgi:signal transduction histidine kinase
VEESVAEAFLEMVVARAARSRPGDPRDPKTKIGPLVSEAERDKVGQRFYRLESSRSTPGNGLGLSLVKAVAKLHRAELLLEDNAPGLKATLRLPIAPG